jgi:serine/threonine-protein kinase
MSDLIGKTIDQYQIVELIEDFGTFHLYKGFQPNMNRYVAVAVLHSQDSAAVAAFNQQNTLLAQVQHTNILPIIDSGVFEARPYRVLRYAEGGLLRDHLFEYYDPHKAAGLLSGVVAGLEKIHAGGYVHGHLEPENIYLDEGDQPLLADFGLSRTPGAPLTPYLSPEQIQGGVVDRRTDVYALGVLLYEMLTGEAPPSGVVVSPRAKRPDLPEAVEKVIFKAMAQNPDARFQTALEFQNALISALRPVVPAQASIPQTTTPQSSSPYTPPPPAPQKTNWAAIILGIVLLVVICGGIVMLFSWWNSRDGDDVALEPTSPPAEIIPTDEPPEPTEEPEPTQEPEATDEPGEPGSPPELPEVCSSTGFAGGFFLLGTILMARKGSLFKRRRSDEYEEI